MDRKIIVPVSLAVAVGLAGFFLLPLALFGRLDSVRGMTYGLLLPMCVTAIVTGWYILTSLKEFKTSSRHAYYIICAGIFLLLLAQVEQAAATLLYEFFPKFIAAISPLIALLFLGFFSSSMLALYIGVHKLAVLLNVKTLGRSTVFAVLISLALSGLSFFLPYSPAAGGALPVMIVVVITFAVGLTLAASFVAVKIKDTISSSYRAPMSWLAIGLGVLAVAILQEIVFKATTLASSAYVHYSLDLLPCLLATFLFMKAGHAFKAATFKQLPTDATYLDSVVYTADLVSNKSMIDSALNDMRAITAHMDATATLSDPQKKVLLDVYLRIEEYLVSKEVLRDFTKSSLRERLTTEFQKSLDQFEIKPAASAPAK